MADNVTVKDGAGSNVTFRTSDLGSGIQAPHNIIESMPGQVAAGGDVPTVINVTGGYNGSNVQSLQLDSSNFLKVILQAGTALAGKVGIDQTTAGTTNAVSLAQLGTTTVATGNGTVSAGVLRVSIASDSTGQVIALGGASSGSAVSGNPVLTAGSDGTNARTILTDTSGNQKIVLVAGTAVAGKFGIDQTTPGTTNAVAITAGTNLIGKAGIDQTTPGTTNAVAISTLNTTAVATGNGTASAGVLRVSICSDSTGQIVLAAGSALAGKFGIDQTTAGTTNAVALSTLGANAVATGNGTASTGTLRVSICSDSTGQIIAKGAGASGSAVSGNPVLTAGSDGTNARTVLTDTTGKQIVTGSSLVQITGSGAGTTGRTTDTATYAAGDVINNSTSAGTIYTFTGAAKATGGSGVINRVFIDDSFNQTLPLQCELWLFSAAPAAQNDNAAFAPTDAESATVVAIIPFISGQAYVANSGSGTGGNQTLDSGIVNMAFVCNADANLYGQLVARNAFVPGSAEKFNVRLQIYQD